MPVYNITESFVFVLVFLFFVLLPVMLSYVLKFISMWSHWKTKQLSELGAAIVTYTSFLKLNVSTDRDSVARDWWRTKSAGKTRKPKSEVDIAHFPDNASQSYRLRRIRSVGWPDHWDAGPLCPLVQRKPHRTLWHWCSAATTSTIWHGSRTRRRCRAGRCKKTRDRKLPKQLGKERNLCVTQTPPTALW